jgi:aspartate aminotransferase, mitochondrial
MFRVLSTPLRAINTSTVGKAYRLPGSTLNNHFSSLLRDVPMGPPDKILGLNELFKNDSNPLKVSLGVGAYRGDDGKPLVLDVVREAERRIVSGNMDHEYAGIAGVDGYVKLSLKFAYGDNQNVLDRIAAVQSLSGTGACRIAGEFFARFIGQGTKIYMPNPTWPNHIPIMKNAGLEPAQYTYYDADGCKYNHKGCVNDITNAPNGSVFLMHACAHNPTGCDPSKEQWNELSKLMKEKGHIVFFDSAYQGFASGNAEVDAYAVRKFVEDGHDILLAQSFAKNFGLYGERIGTLSVVCQDVEEKKRVDSQLKLLVRPSYSNPPVHGARIVQEILSDETLSKKWEQECRDMADRMHSMRSLLKNHLSEAGSVKNWDHITDQIGMFAFTGLTTEQVLEMRGKHSVYCTDDGRISIAGINTTNVKHIAMAIHDVTK